MLFLGGLVGSKALDIVMRFMRGMELECTALPRKKEKKNVPMSH